MLLMDNQSIGILDSGIGGLSVWREIVKKLPNESTVYIGDSKNCPYGNKSEQEIYHLSRRLVEFLIKQKCKLIVIACNTITVSCLDRLRKDFPHIPIVGTVPVIKTAAKLSKNKTIGVLSTTKTANSKYQKDLIEKFAGDCEVINRGANSLVPLIEKLHNTSILPSMREILQKELAHFKNACVDTLVLGCSHFPFIKPQIQQILGERVRILDSGKAIARQVERVLQNNAAFSQGKERTHTFFTSGEKEHFLSLVQKLVLRKPIKNTQFKELTR